MKRVSEEKLKIMADFINEFVLINGYAPSFKEILWHVGMSNSVGYRYLLILRDRGIVEYNGRGTLRVRGLKSDLKHHHRIPIVGIVTCGSPEDNREEVLGYLAIPEEWINGECFLLKASGDSMVDIGIEQGDLVLIQKATSAHDGQIVAALTENGTTLKRYKADGSGNAWLLAENRSYPKRLRELHPS